MKELAIDQMNAEYEAGMAIKGAVNGITMALRRSTAVYASHIM